MLRIHACFKCPSVTSVPASHSSRLVIRHTTRSKLPCTHAIHRTPRANHLSAHAFHLHADKTSRMCARYIPISNGCAVSCGSARGRMSVREAATLTWQVPRMRCAREGRVCDEDVVFARLRVAPCVITCISVNCMCESHAHRRALLRAHSGRPDTWICARGRKRCAWMYGSCFVRRRSRFVHARAPKIMNGIPMA